MYLSLRLASGYVTGLRLSDSDFLHHFNVYAGTNYIRRLL